MSKNVGKIFEDDFVKSIDSNHVLVKRLNDNASSWSGGNKTRFTSTNECDFILFENNTHTFYGIELKSTQGRLTFWREDFDKVGSKNSYNIKKNQILGLKKWRENFTGVFGIIFNFREHGNQTFFVDIFDFIDYTSTLSKKSIAYDDVNNMKHIEIFNFIKRTHYTYNTELFLEESYNLYVKDDENEKNY